MRTLAAIVTVVGLAGCSGAGATAPSQSTAAHNPVQATADLTFTPKELTIGVGDSVTFVIGSVEHSIEFQKGEELRAYYGGASSAGAPSNVAQTSNAEVVRAFKVAGSFKYRCTIHAGMIGEITVR